MANSVNWLVPKVHLNDNDSVDLIIEVGDFGSGNWAEISGYITQENGVYAPFSSIQKVPHAPVGSTPTVTVNVPPMGLVPGQDVKVITRVAAVQIWPTMLGAVPAEQAQGIKATWEARDDASARASNVYGDQPRAVSPTSPPGSGPVTGPDPSISFKDMQAGYTYKITIKVVPT